MNTKQATVSVAAGYTPRYVESVRARALAEGMDESRLLGSKADAYLIQNLAERWGLGRSTCLANRPEYRKEAANV